MRGGRKGMQNSKQSEYDLMKKADEKEEDAFFPEELVEESAKTSKENYFEYYDDIKTDIREDW